MTCTVRLLHENKHRSFPAAPIRQPRPALLVLPVDALCVQSQQQLRRVSSYAQLRIGSKHMERFVVVCHVTALVSALVPCALARV